MNEGQLISLRVKSAKISELHTNNHSHIIPSFSALYPKESLKTVETLDTHSRLMVTVERMPHITADCHTKNEENLNPDPRSSTESSVSTHLASETIKPMYQTNGSKRSGTSNNVDVNTVTPTIARDESAKHGTDEFSSCPHISYNQIPSGGSDVQKSRKRQLSEDIQNVSDRPDWNRKHDTESNRNNVRVSQSMEYSVPYTPATQTQSYPMNPPSWMQPVHRPVSYSTFHVAAPRRFQMIPFTPNQVHQSPYMPAQASHMDHRHPSVPNHDAIVYQNYYGSTPISTEYDAMYRQPDKYRDSYPSSAKKYKTSNDEKNPGEHTYNESLSRSSSLNQNGGYPYDSPKAHSTSRMFFLASPVHPGQGYNPSTESSARNPMEDTPSHIKQFDNVYNTSPMANATKVVNMKSTTVLPSTKGTQNEERESDRLKKTPRRNRKIPQRYMQDTTSEDDYEYIRNQTSVNEDQTARKEEGVTVVASSPHPPRPPTHTVANVVVERVRAQRANCIEGHSNEACTKLLPVEIAEYSSLPRNELIEVLSRSEETSLPHFSDMINYAPSPKLNQNSIFRECAMCGLMRPTNMPKKKGTVNVPIIPAQNKGLCTDCDVGVWMLNDTFTEIKWCKGCKNFKKWIDFGEKLMATKCESCRERQREKYKEKCENRDKDSMERALMYQQIKHRIRIVENNDHSGLDCLLAAASTQLEGGHGSRDSKSSS